MRNIYTLREAKVRDALKWSKDINKIINTREEDIQMLLGSTDLTALLELKQAGIKRKTEVLTKLQDSLVDFRYQL
ncbi:beta-lactamase domain-containing protein [Vibrio nigripulchritudo ATCC 27043]|uniref:hypothetical protein n=1 Tax=Vibrio nigripulchritudo TaxID=28173 RepID=UPI00021C2A70|nr:hypothetical protein [Vibrio nigripulchritudo]EGU56220.1 beta-lactamase domain-containing protein [Vibrio nigripulchritudo ATCC 27043]